MNIFFNTIFLLEVTIKIIGLGRDYFKIGWNVYEFTVLILGIVTTVISNAIITIDLEQIIQIIRILRTLSLIRTFKRLNLIFSTLASSLPGIGNTGALLFVIIYVYAILGI
jgi:hypothetical protein